MQSSSCSRFRQAWSVALVFLTAGVSGVYADRQAIGYIETFALADDRVEALEELVPGSAEYYYYHCLHYQNTGRLELVDPLVEMWRERHRGDARIEVIRNRQAVLMYDRQPEQSIARLRTILGLHFNHQRDRLDPRTRHATRLDQDQISRAAFLQYALNRHRTTVDGFAYTAYEWLLGEEIGLRRRRDLLGRLTRPDYPDLVEHIAADLRWEHSRGFGQHAVHGLLTLEQLEALRREITALSNDDNYIHAVLRKLQPGPETDIEFDRRERRVYLDRLWSFVRELPAGQNALKANVLYHLLDLDRREERFEAALFEAYVRLPRYLPYVNEDWIRPLRQRGEALNLNADYREATGLPPVGDDEPLVRAYLLHLLRGADDFAAYAPYIRERYLNAVLAEANLLAGLGDPERWYSLLTPAQVQGLRDRIDIDFTPSNPDVFRPGDPVTLEVDVKNVGELRVRVFRINVLNVYKTLEREIDAGLDLDGLEPRHTEVFAYREPPIRRVRRALSFPEVDEPGVYVIDLIGNGRSSRALLRVGGLNYTMRHGPAGHVFRLYDEGSRPVDGGAIHLGARRYEADADGTVTVPYSTDPGRRSIILEQGARVSFDRFEHASENYDLRLGAHVERETLMAHETAALILRPVLRLNGTRMPLGLLEDVRLTIVATDLDGVSSTQVVEPFTLDDDGEAVHLFRVPPRLRGLQAMLEGRIQPVAGGEPQALAAGRELSVNAITETAHIAMPLLLRDGGGHILEVRGRNGEVLAGHGVRLSVRHRDFTVTRNFSLQTDDNGRVALGSLPDIASLSVRTSQGGSRDWNLGMKGYSYPETLTLMAGRTLHVPWPAAAGALTRSAAGLLERVNGTYATDRFEHLALQDGYLTFGDLPPGDYQLVLKRDERRMAVHVSGGAAHGGDMVSEQRSLEATVERPMALGRIEADDRELRIRLSSFSPRARVHLIATHYAPAFDAFEALHVGGRPEPRGARFPRHGAVYLSGRDIGDEYRYVLDRRDAPRFPGNMLGRPGLLLNPWVLRETETGVEHAVEGDAFAARRRSIERAEDTAVRRPRVHRAPAPAGDLADVDFLAQPAVVLSNLRPDADGLVRIDLRDLEYRGWVRVVAVDGDLTATAEQALSHREAPRRERRLVRALDPGAHVIQRRATTVHEAGDVVRFDDPTAAELEVFDSLAAVFRLYTTLAAENDGVDAEALAGFRFLTEWPGLDDTVRRERYSRYASHELHFFLYHKDREFFDAVVRPYLENKKDKTFMDHYLLGADLLPYRERWRFARLNIVERILLGRRLGEAGNVARHVDDLFALLPLDIEADNRLFEIALKGGALDTDAAAAVLNGLAFDADAVQPAAMRRGLYAARAAGVPPGRDMKVATERPSARLAAPPSAVDVASESYVLEDAVEARRRVRVLYQDIAPTREWAENNYYHVPIAGQNADLVGVNPFWRDLAAHDPAEPFRSPHFAHAAGNLSEMLLALALLDLPFESREHAFERDQARIEWRAAAPAIVLSRRIESVATFDADRPILVSQNVFLDSQRTQRVDNETVDRFVSEGFVIDTVYGLRLVLSNPTSAPQRLDLLGQVPEGAIALGGHRATTGRHVRLEPFESASVEMLFYFPEPGRFAHFPVHVAHRDTLVAAAEPMVFEVAAEPPGPDTGGWDYISQHGTLDQALEYIDRHNVEEIKLERIAWRMRDGAVFNTVLERLDGRHVYNHTLWSYGLFHVQVPAIRQYLRHNDFADRCGAWLDAALLTVDPVERRLYEHLEYDPLVNARAHPLGAERRIVNDALRDQYRSLLDILAHRARLDDSDRMAVVYYLLLQDRIAEALGHFELVDPEKLDTRLQHDAFSAYLAFFSGDYGRARAIAARHAGHPVKRWSERFRDIIGQLDALEGVMAEDSVLDTHVDLTDRDRRQDRLAATDPALEIEVTDGRVNIGYANLEEVTLNLYRMDIELLFSGQPFVQDYGERFAFVEPNRGERLRLEPNLRSRTFDLPADLRRYNLMVEALGAGLRRSQIVFSNALEVRLAENYGRLSVAAREDDAPQGSVYVKVYARQTDGKVRFHKDGYTDPRGQFDYATVSGPRSGGGIERFSILVLSDTHGAVIREAPPPVR